MTRAQPLNVAPEFTPGPWEIDYPSIYAPALGIRAGRVAAVSIAYKDTATFVANARLIAAAPELYAALAEISERCPPFTGDPYQTPSDFGNSEDYAKFVEEMCAGTTGDIARAALAKARGETVSA